AARLRRALQRRQPARGRGGAGSRRAARRRAPAGTSRVGRLAAVVVRRTAGGVEGGEPARDSERPAAQRAATAQPPLPVAVPVARTIAHRLPPSRTHRSGSLAAEPSRLPVLTCQFNLNA